MLSSPAFLDASTLDDLHQDRDDRKYDEDVNESAHRGRSDQAQNPQYQQDHRNCVQHVRSPYPDGH